MNATKEEDISSEGIIISQTRVWLFGGSVDGVVIMFPIYLIGTVMNSFQLWILRTKANLDTRINALISMECVVRLLICSVVYWYKAWILLISPTFGYILLPDPIQCYIAGLFTYIGTASASVFNMLTNFLRFLYVCASDINSWRGIRARKWLLKSKIHSYLLFFGFLVIALHGVSTMYVPEDQFYFDQACLRPHGLFQKQTLGTRFHLYFLVIYNLVSIGLCGSMCIIIQSAEKKLESLLKSKSNHRKRNFYTAATGLLHFAIMTILTTFTQLQLMTLKTWEVKMTTSIQSFLLEFMLGVIHGIVTPCFIFWSSTEARHPAINQLLLLKYQMSCTFTIFSRFSHDIEEISMTKSRNSVIGDLNVEVVARSTEGKIHSNEVSEAPENSESPKIPDVCSNRKISEIGNLNDGLVGDPEVRIQSNEAPELSKDS